MNMTVVVGRFTIVIEQYWRPSTGKIVQLGHGYLTIEEHEDKTVILVRAEGAEGDEDE